MIEPCTCGNPRPHEIARRQLADGRTWIVIWSDGDVTWRMGFAIRGVGTARSPARQRLDAIAARLLADEIGLLEPAEVASGILAVRRLVRRSPEGTLLGAGEVRAAIIAAAAA